MGKYIAYSLLSLFMLSSTPGICTTLPQEVMGSYRDLHYQKFNVEGHTYIHFINGWSGYGDVIIHDPRCAACAEGPSLDDVIEEIKRTCSTIDDMNSIDALFEEVKKIAPAIEAKDAKDKKKSKKKDH